MYGYDIFHEKLLESLIANVRRGNPPHAYIFEGESGVGRFEAARLFAAALVCTVENQPCGICHACIGQKAGTNPDVVIVEPEEKRKTIGADRIRDLISDAYLKPFESARKVYIFKDAKIITEQAQNAFLKLLEEPPEYAVFIILAENADTLLQTVRSRCIKVRFAPVSTEKMTAYIKKIAPQCDNPDFVIRYAHGIPGEAERILGDADFDITRKASIAQLGLLFDAKPISAYKIADFIDENKDNADLILSFWREAVRDILLISSHSEDIITNCDCIDELNRYASTYPPSDMVQILEEITEAEEMLRRYVSTRAVFVRLGLKLCR